MGQHKASHVPNAARPYELAIIMSQLGRILFASYLFKIEESSGFLTMAPVIFLGFIVHAVLPFCFRLRFFLLLSLASFIILYGPKQGGGLIAVSLCIIGICHFPVALRFRLGALLVVVGFLAAIRAHVIVTFWAYLPIALIPAMAVMFMFRMMVYLYDLRHEKTPASVWERLSYFFLLPTACFPLFPVIDFNTFRRTYYDRGEAEIY